eukprot:TRINITY_DN2149_c0_g2_i5.p1 TRINITY_DN2149_c0_g2~~TRINITY_DN2149_c0_g2_i5.p1  ORF type:complete len:163 (+),score=29.30 TRINITY_DN2149_c0_g2_i5:71-559(+)
MCIRDRYLILLSMTFNWIEANTIGQLCRSETECTTGCCVLTSIPAVDQVKYLCQSEDRCSKSRMYGAACAKSSDCSSDCCNDGLCTEYDTCFDKYIRPIIKTFLVCGIIVLSLAILILWIWILFLCRKNYKARKFYARLKQKIENILAEDNVAWESINEEER